MPRPNLGPTLWLDPRTEIYQVRWFEKGKRRTRSAGTGVESEAKKYLAAFLIEIAKPDLSVSPTIGEVLIAWRDHKPRLALQQVKSTVKILNEHLGSKIATELRPADVRAYAKLRKAQGKKPGTVRGEVSNLHAAMKWAFEDEIISSLPPIPLPPSGAAGKRWLTEDEVKALLAKCGHIPHLHTFILLAVYTAARTGAILDLKWEHISFDAGIVFYPVKEGGKRRVAVPMTDQLRAGLVHALSISESEYVVAYAGRQLTRVREAFRGARERAKVAKCTPHDLRRTAGSWMLQRGAPIELVSAVLGHSNVKITQAVYAHLLTEHLRPAVDRLAMDIMEQSTSTSTEASGS